MILVPRVLRFLVKSFKFMIASNSLANHLNADAVYVMDGSSAQKRSALFTVSCKRLIHVWGYEFSSVYSVQLQLRLLRKVVL